MDAKSNIKARLPSRHVTEGPERAPHRSYYYAMGLTTDQIHQRVLHAATELAAGERLGATLVVNDRLDDTVDQVLALIDAARRDRS